MTSEESRAVAEAAKFGQEVVKATRGLGGYVAKIVGEIPQDLLGLAGGDWVSHARKRNCARLEEKTQRILESVSQDRFTPPSPSLLIPLLLAAVDETREELQDLWAALLANTVTDDGKRVRRDFFEAVRMMEPEDARVLSVVGRLVELTSATSLQEATAAEYAKLQESLSVARIGVSINALQKLGCLSSPYINLTNIVFMPFGRALLDACSITDLTTPKQS